MENELFEKTSVQKAYFKLVLPVVISMVILLIYNMVDTYFVAKTGNTNMVAGVSLAAPIFTLMVALGDIWGLGGSSIISRLFGQKKNSDGKRLSVFCFYAAFACGIIISAVMLLLHQPILKLLGANSATITYSFQYYTFIVLGAPFILFSITASNLLRTEGCATNAMIGNIAGTIINIIFNPIFISVLNWGAAGSAIATVTGNICADLYYIWFLLKRSRYLSINIKLFCVSSVEICEIFSIGIPASMTNLMQSFGIFLTNWFLLPYGTLKVATMGIVMKINLIAILILVGFAFGAQPLIGYNYGAQNNVRLKQTLQFCYLFECGISIILAVILSIAAPAIIRIFMNNTKIVAIGTPMLRMQLISMFFVAIILVTTCTFQSTGKAFGAFLLSVSRQGFIFSLVIIFASRIAGYSGVLASQALSDILTSGLAIILFYTGLHKEIKHTVIN